MMPMEMKQEWDYSILDRSGYSIARVSKELFHMTDTYVIDVQDPGNALDALMFVLAIDAEKCSRNQIVDLVVEDIRRWGGSMGLFKKKIVKKTYDREHMKPVIRASICTGEEVAGFKDIQNGKIEEIMLIRSPEDLERFKEIYEITEEIAKEYQTLDKGDVLS